MKQYMVNNVVIRQHTWCGTIHLKDQAWGCSASVLVVMQPTHRLSITDEVRFVPVLHALSEIELKLKFFRWTCRTRGASCSPVAARKKRGGSGPWWMIYCRVSMLCAGVQLDRLYNREVTAIGIQSLRSYPIREVTQRDLLTNIIKIYLSTQIIH